jgi:hypothetical protein
MTDTSELQAKDEGLTTAALAGAGNGKQSGVAPNTTDQTSVDRDQPARLFPPGDADDLRIQWDSVQAGFVDEPRRAVEQADSLVAGAMKRLAETFAEERARLEAQWDRGDNVSTEDLRVALQRYRSFFGRLLSM